ERYGGTVEKFIGDAVMAVWGTPIAREDDAERAVRAGLELVEIVASLVEGLAMRVGVVTGEAAVTIGAEGQGMVAGDLVNTASRVQATATAGTVLVGERTRRASEAAIAYEDAGAHELKGKSEPVPLSRLRGRHRVLGARRDGAHAGRDRRAGATGDGGRQAPGNARAAPPRRRGARVGRAAARAAARARRARLHRPRRPLCGLAPLL